MDEKETVIFMLYRKTRQRIKVNAAMLGINMKDYLEKIVPGGEKEP